MRPIKASWETGYVHGEDWSEDPNDPNIELCSWSYTIQLIHIVHFRVLRLALRKTSAAEE